MSRPGFPLSEIRSAHGSHFRQRSPGPEPVDAAPTPFSAATPVLPGLRRGFDSFLPNCSLKIHRKANFSSATSILFYLFFPFLKLLKRRCPGLRASGASGGWKISPPLRTRSGHHFGGEPDTPHFRSLLRCSSTPPKKTGDTGFPISPADGREPPRLFPSPVTIPQENGSPA